MMKLMKLWLMVMTMKLKVQAQHLQPGDIVGSGEKVSCVIQRSIHWPSSKVWVELETKIGGLRNSLWGKYTMINVERPETIEERDSRNIDACYSNGEQDF